MDPLGTKKTTGRSGEGIKFKRILMTLAGIIIGTVMGQIVGWIVPFLLFGDGSSLYLRLKSFGPEPYVVVVLAMTVLGALAGGITGYASSNPEKAE